MYKLFIFDLDGTIVNSVPSLSYTTNKALKEFGFSEIESEKFKLYAGKGAREMVRRCLEELSQDTEENLKKVSDRFFEMFKDTCLYEVKSYDGLTETLKELKKRGYKLAVCTNKRHENAVEVVEHVYGKGFFDYILGEMPTHKLKPSPEGALLIADKMNVSSSECVYAGDTGTDMQTGKGAGMFTVGVLWGFRKRSELEENGADMIIEKPAELLSLT